MSDASQYNPTCHPERSEGSQRSLAMLGMTKWIKFECAVFFILGIIIFLLSEWLTQPPLTFLLLLGYSSGAALWIMGRVRYLLIQHKKSELSRGAI